MESRQFRPTEHAAMQSRAPLVLRSGELRLTLDPDGAVRHLESRSERRLLFGREQIHVYRVQGESAYPVQRLDTRISSRPGEATFSSRADSLEVSQTVRLLRRKSSGYSRNVNLRNVGQHQTKVRLLSLSDPTTAHFRERSYLWGTVGLNAFNRTSHVALDEVAEPSSARVIGSTPSAKVLYMTSEKGRAMELIERGELLESTAGMSGQVLVLFEHEFDIQPGESVTVEFVSLYNASRLDAALADFESSIPAALAPAQVRSWFACSSAVVSSAFNWALASLEGVEFESDLLDKLECLRGLCLVNVESQRRIIDGARALITGAGWVPHSQDPWKPGVLETSLLVDGSSRGALLSEGKKHSRAVYPALRRAANFLLECSRDGSVKLDSSLPQGWRRRIGKGCPTGEIPEVTLSVSGALLGASSVAARIGRPQEAAKFRDRALVLLSSVRKRMVDERGFLALCLDGSGKLSTDETVDQVVASYRQRLDKGVSVSLVHRMLERDFETGLGPRTLPTSNRLVFNPSYGDGQIGGYWTRAALAHVVLAYSTGLGGTGSLELEAIAKLVATDFSRYGLARGDFPYWLEPGKKEPRSQGSDPVAAARYVEAAVAGELGVSAGQDGAVIEPGVSSSFRWAAGGSLLTEAKVFAFVGRAGGRCFTFASGARPQGSSDLHFTGAEGATAEDSRTSAVSFYGPGQVVCVGNSSEETLKTSVHFRPKDPGFAKKLTAGLSEFDAQSGSWRKTATVRVAPSMSLETSLGPGDWKAFRVSP